MAKQTVKVKLTGTGEEAEVSSLEAQEAFARGAAELEGDTVRVQGPENQTGTVDRANLSEALAQGWQIASDAEVEAKSLRREASGVVGTVQGGTEALLRGATVGLSDPIIETLGGDAKRMRARQESLGDAGTALEVGGAIGASLLTGGGGAVAQGTARGAGMGTARALARRGLGAVTAPTRAAARAGDAVAGLIGGAEAGLGRQVAGRVVGGAVEGGLGGLGGVVSESVLTEKDLTAEALLGGLAAGAVFGGATDGAGAAVFGGLARGAGATREGLRKLLSRETGIPASELPDALVDSAAKERGWVETYFEKTAALSGADPVIAKRVGAQLAQDPKRVQDLLNRKGEIETSVAETLQTGLANVRETLSSARIASQGEAKYANLAGKLPRNADFVAPRLTEELRGKMENRLAAMAAENQSNFGRAYDVGALREASLLAKRAFEESRIDGGGAMASFRAIDRFKRDVGELINSTGGWGAPKPGTTTDMVAANKALKEMHGEARAHLEREDLWGQAAVQQRELNASYAASARAAQEFKQIATGSGVRGLFAPDGTVNLRTAISLARQFRRQGGSEVVSKLDEVLDAQLAHLDTVRKNYDLDKGQIEAVERAHASVKEIREKMAAQADDAALLDDLESLREAESNRSVSMGALSTIGPSVGTMVGFGALGPIGGALGAVAGGVVRPYSSARTMASLLSLTDKFRESFDAKGYIAGLSKKTAKARAKLAKLTSGAGAAARRGARGAVVGGAFQAGKKGSGYRSTSERQAALTKAADRVAELGTAENLRRALGPEWEALAADMPELAAEFDAVIQRAVQYLDQRRPQIHRRPFSGRPPIVDPAQAARFERRYEAVVDPMGTIARLKDGTLTVEHVDALRSVYPLHYQTLVDGIQEALVAADERGEAPSHRDRVRLGVLLGQPLDAALEPAHLAAMQGVYGSGQAQAQGAAAPSTKPSPAAKVRGPGVDRMSFDRLETPAEVTASGRLRT